MRACQLYVAHETFFPLFQHETVLFTSGSIPFLFFPLSVFYCLFIMSILNNKQML